MPWAYQPQPCDGLGSSDPEYYEPEHYELRQHTVEALLGHDSEVVAGNIQTVEMRMDRSERDTAAQGVDAQMQSFGEQNIFEFWGDGALALDLISLPAPGSVLNLFPEREGGLLHNHGVLVWFQAMEKINTPATHHRAAESMQEEIADGSAAGQPLQLLPHPKWDMAVREVRKTWENQKRAALVQVVWMDQIGWGQIGWDKGECCVPVGG